MASLGTLILTGLKFFYLKYQEPTNSAAEAPPKSQPGKMTAAFECFMVSNGMDGVKRATSSALFLSDGHKAGTPCALNVFGLSLHLSLLYLEPPRTQYGAHCFLVFFPLTDDWRSSKGLVVPRNYWDECSTFLKEILENS